MSELNTATDLKQQTNTNASTAATQDSTVQGTGKEVSPEDLPKQQPDEEQDLSSYPDIHLEEGVSFSPQDMADFKALAGELGLSAQQVQKLVDFESACAKRQAAERVAKKQQQTAAWANETRALYGSALEREVTFALRAANAFGGPELRELLEETGLGNHPVIIRTLSGIGKTISEDACPGGTPAVAQDKTFAEALYGKQN